MTSYLNNKKKTIVLDLNLQKATRLVIVSPKTKLTIYIGTKTSL